MMFGKTPFVFISGTDDLKKIKINTDLLEGEILIPNITDFCEIRNSRCINNCYNFGYCTKSKKCIYTNTMNFFGNCPPEKYLLRYSNGSTFCTFCSQSNQEKQGKSDGSGKCIQKNILNNVLQCKKNGEFLNKILKKCVICAQDCQICKSENSCSSCLNNFYLKQGKCVKCDQKFEQKTGLNNGNGICIDCPSNCMKCHKDDPYCENCDENYYLTENLKACTTCNEIGKYKTFFQNNTRVCKSCDKNCLICNTVGDCTKCKGSYFVFEKKCSLCNSDGLFKNITDNKCYTCGENCIKCKSSDQCQSCSNSFSINENYQCIKCTDEGYFIENGYCKKCQENCLKCFNYEDCTSCKKGYGLNKMNKCQDCNDRNCLECHKSNEKCENCKPGFLLANDNSCFKCEINNCKSCYLNKTCKECSSGFDLINSKTKCLSCSLKNCQNCLSDDYCKNCDSGFYLKNGACVKCSLEGCISCKSDNICLRCDQSEYFLSKTSQKCVKSNCDKGFAILNEKCKKCHAPCQECNFVNNKNYCLSCISINQTSNDGVCIGLLSIVYLYFQHYLKHYFFSKILKR